MCYINERFFYKIENNTQLNTMRAAQWYFAASQTWVQTPLIFTPKFYAGLDIVLVNKNQNIQKKMEIASS